jgi:hypothetical protein
MTNKKNDHEHVIAQLIHSGFGGDARLDAAFKERTRQRLVGELHSRHPAVEFPDRCLVVLGLMLVGAAVWLAMRAAGAGVAAMMRMPLILIVLPLLINLAFVPLAGLAVLRRRKRHARSA